MTDPRPPLRRGSERHLAVGFHSCGRGSRCRESLDTRMPRAWAKFPIVTWPVLAHGALEVLRLARREPRRVARRTDMGPRERRQGRAGARHMGWLVGAGVGSLAIAHTDAEGHVAFRPWSAA